VDCVFDVERGVCRTAFNGNTTSRPASALLNAVDDDRRNGAWTRGRPGGVDRPARLSALLPYSPTVFDFSA